MDTEEQVAMFCKASPVWSEASKSSEDLQPDAPTCQERF